MQVPAIVQAATRGLTPQQKQKVNDAAGQLVDQKKGALEKLRDWRASQPMRTAGQLGGGILVGAEAGATDALAEALGVPRPLGIRPSHVKGTVAIITTGLAWYMGWNTVVDLAAPVAAGNLIPHAYGLGYGAVMTAKKAVDSVKAKQQETGP